VDAGQTMCEACDDNIGPAYDGCQCSTPSCMKGDYDGSGDPGYFDGCGDEPGYLSNYDCEQAFGEGWILI
jgi:hypothetical protein